MSIISLFQANIDSSFKEELGLLFNEQWLLSILFPLWNDSIFYNVCCAEDARNFYTPRNTGLIFFVLSCKIPRGKKIDQHGCEGCNHCNSCYSCENCDIYENCKNCKSRKSSNCCKISEGKKIDFHDCEPVFHGYESELVLLLDDNFNYIKTFNDGSANNNQETYHIGPVIMIIYVPKKNLGHGGILYVPNDSTVHEVVDMDDFSWICPEQTIINTFRRSCNNINVRLI
jgi:hypothetical protein